MGTVSQLKKNNVLRVLQTIRSNSTGITRPELAIKTGLTGTTVQNIINELEEKGVVLSEGAAVSIGGRKAQKFVINPRYSYLISVYMRVNKVVIGLYDYTINLIEKEHCKIDLSSNTVEETVLQISEMITALLTRKGISKSEVAGIGFSVPGPVDFERGVVITIRGYNRWTNISLKERLEKLLNIPTYVDKDVNSCVSFLKWIHAPGLIPNMLYISIEDGIGAALMINGTVYRGNHGIAGEIGHLTVDNNTTLCACGNKGCIETVASDFAIMDRVRKEMNMPRTPDMDDVIKMATEGNTAVKNILREAVVPLSVMIRNTFLMYDPDEVFINCLWLQKNQDLFFELIDNLHDSTSLIGNSDLNISLIDIPNFGLKSAAAIVATHEIESPDSSVFK